MKKEWGNNHLYKDVFEKAVNKMQNVFVRLLTDSTVAVNIPSILLQYGFTFASWRKLLFDTLQNTSPRKGESWECWRMRCITIFHDIVTKHFSDKSIKCGSAMSKKLKNRVKSYFLYNYREFKSSIFFSYIVAEISSNCLSIFKIRTFRSNLPCDNILKPFYQTSIYYY